MTLETALFPYVQLPNPRNRKELGLSLFLEKYQPRDAGPPAAPVLMVRLARRALAENPQDMGSYLALSEGYRLLDRALEKYWTRDQPALELPRTLLRQMQIAAGVRGALQVQPDNPQLHLAISEIYQQQRWFDLAVHHLREAERLLRLANPPADAKFLQQVHGRREQFEAELNRRLDNYRLNTANVQGLEKYRWAIGTDKAHQYRVIDANNKPQIDPRGRGLVKVALDALAETLDAKNRKNLNPRELAEGSATLLHLLLLTGQVSEAAYWVRELKEELGPPLLDYEIYLAGVLGRYSNLLELLEYKQKSFVNPQAGKEAVLEAGMVLGLSPNSYLLVGLLAPIQQQHALLLAQELYYKTLAASIALERGDTRQAQRTLREVVDRAGPHLQFIDRPLAERYLQLLDQQLVPGRQ